MPLRLATWTWEKKGVVGFFPGQVSTSNRQSVLAILTTEEEKAQNGEESHLPEVVQAGYQDEVFHQEGGWALGQATQGSGHGTKRAGVQAVSGQHTQAYGPIFGWWYEKSRPGLDNPSGSLTSQDILRFDDSNHKSTHL